MANVVVNIPRNKEVEPTVPVVVSKRRSGRPIPQRYSCLFRYVSERSVMVVVIQPILAKIGDIDIRPSIVVVISHCDAVPPTIVCHSGLGGNIGKCSIVVVMKQRS